jgi:hypothetical protein
MAEKNTNDPFAAVREAGTAAPNFDLNNDAIIAELTRWQSLCSFSVTSAGGDRVEIVFATFPSDMDAFARDLYRFCPDLVDQGTGCLHEMVEAMAEAGEEMTPELKKLTEGVDFSDENYGVEVLKREILQRKNVQLWWD